MIILKSLTTSGPTLRDPALSLLLLIKSGPTALLVFSPKAGADPGGGARGARAPPPFQKV